MKKILQFLFLVIFLISCKKEDSSFISEYGLITGSWDLEYISYDSSGITIMKKLPYDRLVINENLDYQIYMYRTEPVEDGVVNIITQTDKNLQFYFDAHYPSYSSYAGSHIFGFSKVALVSLTTTKMIFKTIHEGYGEFLAGEISFTR